MLTHKVVLPLVQASHRRKSCLARRAIHNQVSAQLEGPDDRLAAADLCEPVQPEVVHLEQVIGEFTQRQLRLGLYPGR